MRWDVVIGWTGLRLAGVVLFWDRPASLSRAEVPPNWAPKPRPPSFQPQIVAGRAASPFQANRSARVCLGWPFYGTAARITAHSFLDGNKLWCHSNSDPGGEWKEPSYDRAIASLRGLGSGDIPPAPVAEVISSNASKHRSEGSAVPTFTDGRSILVARARHSRHQLLSPVPVSRLPLSPRPGLSSMSDYEGPASG